VSVCDDPGRDASLEDATSTGKGRRSGAAFRAMDARVRATAIVASLGGGTPGAPPSAEALLPLVYDDLRRRAAAYLRRERAGHTLQPTALVHEAYLKLVDQSRVNWRGRTHFFAVGAKVMRRLLIDHARQRGRAKRAGGLQRVTLTDWRAAPEEPALDADALLGLDRALEALARLDARQAGIVELRFFAGLTVAEVAKFLDVSTRTVEDDWHHARAWLRRELEGPST
jgi:RNA polymerase sigma-70 factor (ECF subfamily)